MIINLNIDICNYLNNIKIVTLCGSSKFKREFRIIEKKLALDGYLVLSLSFYSHSDNMKLSIIQKTKLDIIHLKRMMMSDIIYIINKNGYIGNSTKREIKLATFLNKKILYLE